jgi:hypothetical protein
MTAPPRDPIIIQLPRIKLPRLPHRTPREPRSRRELVFTYTHDGRILQHLVPRDALAEKFNPECRSSPDTWTPGILGGLAGSGLFALPAAVGLWYIFHLYGGFDLFSQIGYRVLGFLVVPLAVMVGGVMGGPPGWLFGMTSRWAPKPWWTARYTGTAVEQMIPPALEVIRNGSAPEQRTSAGLYEISIGREVEDIVGRRKDGMKNALIGALIVGLLAVMGVVFFTLMATQNPG